MKELVQHLMVSVQYQTHLPSRHVLGHVRHIHLKRTMHYGYSASMMQLHDGVVLLDANTWTSNVTPMRITWSKINFPFMFYYKRVRVWKKENNDFGAGWFITLAWLLFIIAKEILGLHVPYCERNFFGREEAKASSSSPSSRRALVGPSQKMGDGLSTTRYDQRSPKIRVRTCTKSASRSTASLFWEKYRTSSLFVGGSCNSVLSLRQQEDLEIVTDDAEVSDCSVVNDPPSF